MVTAGIAEGVGVERRYASDCYGISHACSTSGRSSRADALLLSSRSGATEMRDVAYQGFACRPFGAYHE